MTDDEISTFIANHEWTFAKSMPEIPHWYTLRRKALSSEGFSAFVQQIRFRGVRFHSTMCCERIGRGFTADSSVRLGSDFQRRHYETAPADSIPQFRAFLAE